MVPELRRAFNAGFTPERYAALLEDLERQAGFPIDFRISETPLFLADGLTRELVTAAHELAAAVTSERYLKEAGRAVPAELSVPGDLGHPWFLQVDFALVRDRNVGGGGGGEAIVPRLIELQSFPSLYGFQWLLDRAYRAAYPAMPAGWTPYFAGLDEESYAACLREVLLDGCAPENVILLEIEPEKQKTRVDFVATERLTGVPTVDVSEVTVRGREAFYRRDGREVPIRRIYNRVIFDEATRKGVDVGPLFRRELDVTWVGHPDWFLLISKFSLPFLDSPYAPEAWFVSDLLDRLPADLEHYVLKPLFSFAGLGVEVGPTAERLRALPKPDQFILQRKVDYEPLVETPDGHAKAEVRMMFAWHRGGLRLINNLVRMSKGAMMGVDFNKDKTWIGASQGYHAPGVCRNVCGVQ
jgi:hypothetical protein